MIRFAIVASSCPVCSTDFSCRSTRTLTSSPVTVSRDAPAVAPGVSSRWVIKPSMSTFGVPAKVTMRITRLNWLQHRKGEQREVGEVGGSAPAGREDELEAGPAGVGGRHLDAVQVLDQQRRRRHGKGPPDEDSQCRSLLCHGTSRQACGTGMRSCSPIRSGATSSSGWITRLASDPQNWVGSPRYRAVTRSSRSPRVIGCSASVYKVDGGGGKRRRR